MRNFIWMFLTYMYTRRFKRPFAVSPLSHWLTFQSIDLGSSATLKVKKDWGLFPLTILLVWGILKNTVFLGRIRKSQKIPSWRNDAVWSYYLQRNYTMIKRAYKLKQLNIPACWYRTSARDLTEHDEAVSPLVVSLTDKNINGLTYTYSILKSKFN